MGIEVECPKCDLCISLVKKVAGVEEIQGFDLWKNQNPLHETEEIKPEKQLITT